MTQGSNEAITRTTIAMPQFTNNMYYGEGPQQFTVRQITQVFFYSSHVINFNTKILNSPTTFL